MRNKIKQLLNKEEGFTLVELLAVLTILALIVGIASPMVGNVITNAEKSADESQNELIINAAQLYELEDNNTLPVTTEELITKGFLEDDGKLKGKSVRYSKSQKKYIVYKTPGYTP